MTTATAIVGMVAAIARLITDAGPTLRHWSQAAGDHIRSWFHSRP